MSGDILVCALRELTRNRRRSALVVTGYALTVAFLITIAAVLIYSRVVQNISISEAGTYFVTWLPACGDIASLSEEDLAKLARGIIPQVCKDQCENCTGCNKKPVDILNEGFIVNTNSTRLLTLDLVDQVATLPTIKDASPCLMFRFRDPQTGLIFSVAGIYPGSLAVSSTCCDSTDLIEGSFLSSSAAGSVLADAGFAINNALKPGAGFFVADEKFEVVGIVDTPARTIKADLYMLFADAERVINRRIHNPLEKEANLILLESRDAMTHGQAMLDVKKLMKGDSLLTSGCYYPAANAVGLNNRMVYLFLLIVGLATVVFSGKIQWAAVVERSRSIAILRAVGWNNRTIILQIVCESLIQSAVGCCVGFCGAAAMLVVLPVNDLLGFDATMMGFFRIEVFVAVGLFAVTAGILAALLPVIVVLRQRPYDVLRRT